MNIFFSGSFTISSKTLTIQCETKVNPGNTKYNFFYSSQRFFDEGGKKKICI